MLLCSLRSSPLCLPSNLRSDRSAALAEPLKTVLFAQFDVYDLRPCRVYRYASIASIASSAHDLPLHSCKCSLSVVTARRRADLQPPAAAALLLVVYRTRPVHCGCGDGARRHGRHRTAPASSPPASRRALSPSERRVQVTWLSYRIQSINCQGSFAVLLLAIDRLKS